jgi:hypothetical protein
MTITPPLMNAEAVAVARRPREALLISRLDLSVNCRDEPAAVDVDERAVEAVAAGVARTLNDGDVCG